MRNHWFSGAALAGLVLSGCSGGGGNAPLPAGDASAPQSVARSTVASPQFAQPDDDFSFAIATGQIRPACERAPIGEASCHAYVRNDYASPDLPSGYGPAQLQAAYGFSGATGGAGALVAVVDAYNDPNAEADQTKYRKTFGLPACTTASGCFKKVNQSGVAGNYPPANAGWSEEISLDLDMVAANCPNCHVLLVEATSSSLKNLGISVNTAVGLGAAAVSNSYGGSEDSTDPSYLPYYNHPGVVITASSGDSGYGPQTPASFGTVVAVGGTTLRKASNARGWTETIWNGTGSGCSLYETKPAWQTDTGCAKRTIGDVAYDANPNTGVAVYDSYREGGFLVFGGTSVSSPAIASLFALAGGSTTAQSLYTLSSDLNDITSGKNGNCGTYLCTAGPGYDGPTGNGSPNGLGAF
jgi:subtilase family serine protease